MDTIKKKVALYFPLGDKKTQWSGLGGAEKRLSYLISHMNSELFDKYIVFRVYGNPNPVKDALKTFIDKDCKVVIIDSDAKAFSHFVKAKYDHVLYADFMVKAIPGVLGACIARSERTLIFVTVDYARWSFKKKWHSLIMRFNVNISSKLDCLYPSSVEILKQHFPKKVITSTPCSLPDLDDYLDRSANVKKENTIVFASRLVPDKNPMMLVEAADSLCNLLRENEYKVLICGLGSLDNEILSYISSRNIGDVVEYIGKQRTIEVFPKAKCFCSLQKNENYPSQSLLEAISSGCICIVTDVGNTREIVKPTFGYYIASDSSSLAHAICEIVNLKQYDSEIMCTKAREFAKENFRPDDAISHYERICI